MSSEIAIKIDNLSKCYHIYEKPHDRLLQMLTHSRKKYFREFWALNDVSFEVRKGESVGIIGRNGSGKSTLLQLICGTLNPTQGNIQTHGRIAALLELGSGFNPEFTGLENVYLNSAVLGLGKDEIDERLDSILAFADIGDFVYEPIKTYSSGMMVRLAFAVAINVDPQILIIDEALSVGDELFQRKCFSRISQIKENGATILFVSHSGSAVVELCDRAILLDAGELLCAGQPKATVGKYQKLIYAPEETRHKVKKEISSSDESIDYITNTEVNGNIKPPANETEPEEFYDPHLISQSTLDYTPQGASIDSAKILTLGGKQVNCLRRGKTYRYTYSVKFIEGAANIRFGMLIKSMTGLELGGAVSAPPLAPGITYVASETQIDVEFKFRCLVNPGTYFLNAGVMGMRNNVDTYLHRVLDILIFKVMPTSNDTATAIVDFECEPSFNIAASTEQKVLTQ